MRIANPRDLHGSVPKTEPQHIHNNKTYVSQLNNRSTRYENSENLRKGIRKKSSSRS